MLEQFGMSATRYYQALDALVERPEVLAYDPLVVKREHVVMQFLAHRPMVVSEASGGASGRKC